MTPFPTIRFIVRGESMAPRFSSGEKILANRLSYALRKPRRGEVVVARDPRDESRELVKRIVAVPGDTIGGVLLRPNEYFLRGDNERQSTDSRTFGPVAKNHIIGKVISMR